MNENIQKLIDASGMRSDVSGKWISNHGFDQFVKLVIDKCSEISYNKWHGIDAAKAITQHFGENNEDI